MLFAWRAIFLLTPLGFAAIVLLVLESRGGHGRKVDRKCTGARR
jgi:hypothetical protein